MSSKSNTYQSGPPYGNASNVTKRQSQLAFTRPSASDEGYRAIIANGIFGSGLFNPGRKTTNPPLDRVHLDKPTGGDYSCNSRDILKSVGLSPWILYKNGGGIPGGRVKYGIVRDDIIAIHSNSFIATDYTFFFTRSSINRNNWLNNNPVIDLDSEDIMKEFQDYSHSGLGLKTGKNFEDNDVDSVVELINIHGYRRIPVNGF